MIQRNLRIEKILYTTLLRQILDKIFAIMIYVKSVWLLTLKEYIKFNPPLSPFNNPLSPPFSKGGKGGLRGIWELLASVLVVIILASTPVRAEIYTYVDENGTIHFTNVPTDPQFKMIIPPKEEKLVTRLSVGIREKDAIKDFSKLIETKSYRYGLDPALVKAVIAVESDFNPRAVSEKGARGLMQLMPMTAYELGVSNSFDPEANIDGGTRYLRYLLDYFNWDIDLALAAYHAGMTRVVQHTGIPPIPATHYYVNKVKSVYSRYILQ